MMIVDFHTHIFPAEIRNRRDRHFQSEPAFKVLYESPKSKMVGAEDLIDAMDRDGIDKSVIFGFPWCTADTFRFHNDYIIQAVDRFPKRLIGFGCFDPFQTGAEKEARRCLENGLAGIGELAFYQSEIDTAAIARLEPILAICREADRPLLIHTNEPVGHLYPGKTANTLAQLYALAKRYPSNKLVFAHWGGGIFFFQLLKKEIRSVLRNVYFDTAASPFLYKPAVYAIAVQLAGVDKILFGSDFPLIGAARYFREMDQAGITPADKARICGLNAAALLKFAPEV
jgi:predicted TIM-barrel fold metal-dependent hydrolase